MFDKKLRQKHASEIEALVEAHTGHLNSLSESFAAERDELRADIASLKGQVAFLEATAAQRVRNETRPLQAAIEDNRRKYLEEQGRHKQTEVDLTKLIGAQAMASEIASRDLALTVARLEATIEEMRREHAARVDELEAVAAHYRERLEQLVEKHAWSYAGLVDAHGLGKVARFDCACGAAQMAQPEAEAWLPKRE